MVYKLVILICLISLLQVLHVQAIRALDDEFCKQLGDISNVICVSKTQFVLSFQDPDADAPVSCPAGTVCSNTEKVCVSKDVAKPACRNAIIGREGCNSCRPHQIDNEPICVTTTEFGFCIKGKVNASMKFACSPSTPYCKATYNAKTGALESICTLDPSITDCPNDTATDNNQPQPPIGTVPINSSNGSTNDGVASKADWMCTEEGFFPSKSDARCQSYIKCDRNSKGSFDEKPLTCLKGFVFNPNMKRCVPATMYKCPVN